MKSASLQQLLRLLQPYKREIFLAVLLSTLPAYFTVWHPFLIGKLIDDGLLSKDANALVTYASLVLGTKILLFVFRVLISYCLSALGLQILVDYRDQLLKKILTYPISFFDRMASGQLTTRLTNDINSLQELFASALVPLIGSTFLIIGVIIGMFVINFRLALVSILIIPLLVWLTAVFHIRIRRRFGFMRHALSSLNSFSAESFAGNRDIQVFDATKENLKDFESLSKRLQKRFVQAVREYALYNPIVPFINSLMDVLILGFGGWMAYRGMMSVGEVVAFLAYASNFNGPIREISEKYTVLQQAMASVDRLMMVSTHDSEKDEGRESLEQIETIEFKNVSFTYPGASSEAIKDIQFSIGAGEKLALLGETGSGKTTTCSLLMRFYEPTKGSILVNQKPLSDYALDSWRPKIGWVSQDVSLFSASLRDNLTFFDSSISDDKIWHALELVQLKSWARSLPKGLDEILTERGSTVSLGQRQLLSLARAVVRRSQVFIFDEATSYIDSQTELALQEAIDRLWSQDAFQKSTAIFIAHRLSTLRKCDRMLAFKNGKIVEAGDFQTLIHSQGYTAKLYADSFS